MATEEVLLDLLAQRVASYEQQIRSLSEKEQLLLRELSETRLKQMSVHERLAELRAVEALVKTPPNPAQTADKIAPDAS